MTFPSAQECAKEESKNSVETYSSSELRRVDPAAEKVAVRRSDWIVFPITFLYAFLSHLDRSNIGNARVAGLQDDLSITDHQYSIALTITFIPYVIAELPINLVLKRVGAHILIPLLVTLWGIITSSQGFVTSYSGLLTTSRRSTFGGDIRPTGLLVYAT